MHILHRGNACKLSTENNRVAGAEHLSSHTHSSMWYCTKLMDILTRRQVANT